MTLSTQHIIHAINDAVSQLAIEKSRSAPRHDGSFDFYACFNAKMNEIEFHIDLTTKRDCYASMAQTVLRFINNTDWKTALVGQAEWLKGFKLKTEVPKKVTDIIGTDYDDNDYDESEHSVGFTFRYGISDSALRTLEREYRKMLKERIKTPKYFKTVKLRTRSSNEELVSFDVENDTLNVKDSTFARGYKVGNATYPSIHNISPDCHRNSSLVSANYEMNNMQTWFYRSVILQDKPCVYTVNMHTAIEILVEREGRQFKMMVTPFKTKIDAYHKALDSIVTSSIDLSNQIYSRARATEISKVVKPCLVRGTKIVSIKTASIKANTNFASIASYKTIKVITETPNHQTICFTIKRNGQVEFNELESLPSDLTFKNAIIKNVDQHLAELYSFDRSYVTKLIQSLCGSKNPIIIFA